MSNHPLGEVMGVTMQKIREMVDVNTVIGAPITTADGITILPVSKVSFGFASGGSDFTTKNQSQTGENPFGGGGGAGVNITPVAFLIVKNGDIRIMNITPPATTTIDRAIDAAPVVIDKIKEFKNKDKE